MTSTIKRGIAGLAAALAAATLATPYAAAPAHAAKAAVAVTYTCVITGGGAQEAHLELSLDQIPDSVAPGASVDLAGSLAITFPDLAAVQSQLMLASKVSLSATSLGIEVRSGDTGSRVIAPSSFKGAETGFNRPFTLTASFTLAGVVVPTDASEIVLRLPNEQNVPNTAGTSPQNVALTLELAQDGLQTQRSAGCWTADGKPVVLARVPVRASASDGGTPAPGTPSASATASATASAAAVPGLPVAPPPAAGGPVAPPPVAAEAAAPPAAGPAAGVAPTAATTPVFYAPVPEPTRSEIFLPSWLLILGALAALTAAVLYGLLLRRRAQLAAPAAPERTS